MRYVAITSVIAVFAMAVAPAQAQCRSFRPHHAVSYQTFPTTYQYPTYEVIKEVVIREVPVVVPVLIPAYQYQYFAPCAPQHQPVQNDQERLRELAKAVVAELQKRDEQPLRAEEDDGPPAVPDVPVQRPTGVQVLANRCASCHTGLNSEGKVMIFDLAGNFNQAVDRRRIIRAAVERRTMPPDQRTHPERRLREEELDALKGL